MMHQSKLQKLIQTILIIIIPLVLIFPLYWMFLTSIKPPSEVFKTNMITLNPTLNNYSYLIHKTTYIRTFLNSVYLSTLSTILTILIAAPCAYIITRFKSKAMSAFALMIMLVYMIPGTLVIIPQYVLAYKIGAANNLSFLSLFYLTFALPFSIWLLRSYLAGIPIALEEAAQIDGCTKFQAFYHVILPLMKPGIVSTAIVTFLMNWQEYLWASLFLRKGDYHTLPVLLDSWFGGDTVAYSWEIVMAAGILTTLPSIIIMIFLQERLVSAMSSGAVKG